MATQWCYHLLVKDKIAYYYFTYTRGAILEGNKWSIFITQAAGRIKFVHGLELAPGPDFGHACFRHFCNSTDQTNY